MYCRSVDLTFFQTFADGLLTEAMEESENVTGLFSWAYSGVNFDLAGNGGIECRDFISVKQRVIETVISCAAAGLILYRAITHLTLPKNSVLLPDPVGKRILLVVHCLIFGIELGFKFATKQMIYILNPCHVATMMQVSLINDVCFVFLFRIECVNMQFLPVLT